MTDQNINEVTPDTLMQRFQGSGLKKIIVFTLVVHVVVLLGSSVPFLVKTVFGANKSEMTQEERVKEAVKEATAAIRDIASDYDLNPQEISDQFASGGVAAPEEVEPAESAPVAEAEQQPGEDADEPERPKSQIEKDLEATAKGPAVPSIDDDIF